MVTRTRQLCPSVAVIARLGRQIASRGRTRFGDTAASLLLAGDGLVYKLTRSVPQPKHEAVMSGAPSINVHRWTDWGAAAAPGDSGEISDGPRA